jgi:adenylate cyclase
MQIRDAVRHQVFERSGRRIEALADTRDMAIAFADLVGFTALSEDAPLTRSTEVAARFEEHASSVAAHPVRLVKLIGDAAMLVSDESEALVRALLSLRQAATSSARR